MKLTRQLSGDTCSPALDIGGHHDPLCQLDHRSMHCKTLVLPASGFKSSLRVRSDAEGPHVIGREKDLLRFDWLDFLARWRQFCS